MINFINLHLPNYDSDTKDLSVTEDGAYFRLLRFQWATGKPIQDVSKALRIVGAQSDAEKQATLDVLHRFFIQTDEGWINPRAIRTFNEHNAFIAKKQAAANKRWHGSDVKRNQNPEPKQLTVPTITPKQPKPKQKAACADAGATVYATPDALHMQYKLASLDHGEKLEISEDPKQIKNKLPASTPRACDLSKNSEKSTELALFAKQARDYGIESGNPLCTNFDWVEAYFKTEMPSLMRKRPEMTVEDFAEVWRHTCDCATAGAKYSPLWYKRAFKGKCGEWRPQRATAGSAPKRPNHRQLVFDAWAEGKALRWKQTGEIFQAGALVPFDSVRCRAVPVEQANAFDIPAAKMGWAPYFHEFEVA